MIEIGSRAEVIADEPLTGLKAGTVGTVIALGETPTIRFFSETSGREEYATTLAENLKPYGVDVLMKALAESVQAAREGRLSKRRRK